MEDTILPNRVNRDFVRSRLFLTRNSIRKINFFPAQLSNEMPNIARNRRNFGKIRRLSSEITIAIFASIDLYGVTIMRYILLTTTALLLVGGEAAQAQFLPVPVPVAPIKRHGYGHHSKPPFVFSLTIVRPTPVVVPTVRYRDHHSKHYPVPVVPTLTPVVPVAPVAPLVAPQLGLVPPQAIVPQISPQQATQLVANWYNQFLHRQPDGVGLQNHVQVVLTQGEDVALSGILGSDEYWQVCGQDVRSWIASLYVGILNRQPREDEIQHWYQVLVNFGGDRQRTVLNFLPASRVELQR